MVPAGTPELCLRAQGERTAANKGPCVVSAMCCAEEQRHTVYAHNLSFEN